MHTTSLRSVPAATLAALLVAGVALAEADAPDGWDPGDTTEAQGFSYQIFAKDDDGEGLVIYQARGKIEAPPETLIRAVRTVVSDPSRAPDGQSRRVVSQDEQGSFTVHTHIDLPAFFSDRDIVTRGVPSVDPDSGRHRIDWRAIEHDDIPPVDDTIRILRSAGFWDFTPDGNGASAAVYETYVDLGGSLPGWLIGPMMGGMVGGTFEDVANEALGH
jgi:hypothetical protein